jgi:FtsP/CotA-like multicopper oxidase with cupredoxin domain
MGIGFYFSNNFLYNNKQIMKTYKITRKKFLRYSGIGASLLFLPTGLLSACKESAAPINRINKDFSPDLEIFLKSAYKEVQILPGKSTKVMSYEGEVLQGDRNSLQILDNNYLGPIIKTKKGQKIRVHFNNEIDAETIIHWHGLHVPEEMDGHPRYVINNGEKFVYEFEVNNRAGTYWFHPHPHGKTGPQVYSGLAGLFLVSDENEQGLNLPTDKYDIPIIIQDRQFDGNNQLVYLDGRMDRMMGFLGDTILVNGKPDFILSAETRPYRLRLLNGSNSRIYKLAWNDETPLTVIGTDGGLLETPRQIPYLTLGPAERYDIWVDFSNWKTGKELTMKSLPFEIEMGMGMGMMRGNMSNMNNQFSNGSELNVFKVRVEKESNERIDLPTKLSKINKLSEDEAVNKNNPRKFHFAMKHMEWTINGKTFRMTDVADNEKVKLNTTEVWEFINGGGGGGMMGMMGNMMQMPHPVHIHGLQFQIIDRIIKDSSAADWDNLKEGIVDEGWKDSFLLLPGTRIKVLLRFEDYKGMFLYHCHNLEHEDMGMMRNYLVE